MNPPQFRSHNQSERFPDFENVADTRHNNQNKTEIGVVVKVIIEPIFVFVCAGVFFGVVVTFVQGVPCG